MRSIWIVVVIFSLFFCSNVFGKKEVVVVPLLSHNARGDAEVTDVKAGKTFSNSSGVGHTGTRAPVPVAKTGQDVCYSPTGGEYGDGGFVDCAGTGMDGEYQKGESISPRFTDNSDGTVTDNLTGLVWLKNFNCFGRIGWESALTVANTLEAGDCGLSDGSFEGDWRLPNRFELESLLDLKQYGLALPPGHPFVNVEPDYYWTSSYHSYFVDLKIAWAIHFSAGDVKARSMIGLELDAPGNCYVQAVRDKM